MAGKVKTGGAKTETGSAAERALSAQAKRICADWSRRHPERAAAERAMHKARKTRQERWGHKRGGTPETLEHAARPGAIARLHLSGAISDDQLAWAAEICTVADALGRDVAVRTARYDMRVDGAGNRDLHGERLGWVRMEAAYSQWRMQAGPIYSALALDMIVRDRSLNSTARAYGRSARRARRMLCAALDLWDICHREARRDIDEKALRDAEAEAEWTARINADRQWAART